MPNPSWFNVVAAAPGAAEVSVRGFIGEWGLTDRDFIDAVKAVGEVSDLTIRINSRGGEVDHALAIFNFLKTHPAKKTVRIDGVAMSAASIVAMAGDEIVMPANTIMMVHKPSTFAAGNAEALRNAADMLDTFEAALLATYVARTGKTEQEVIDLLADETFMTAAEAVDAGFADRVEALSSTAEAGGFARVLASANGIPDAVLAKVQAIEAAALADADDPASPDDQTDTASPLALGALDSLAGSIRVSCEAAGLSAYAADIALDATITDEASAIQAIRDAFEVVELCAVAGQPALAAGLIRKRAGLAEARAEILTARAQADEALHTDGHIPAPNASRRQSAADVWAKVLPTRH